MKGVKNTLGALQSARGREIQMHNYVYVFVVGGLGQMKTLKKKRHSC